MEFLNYSIFYYLFLLAIPVIIHLFNFRKHKKLLFSSTYFLKEINKKNKTTYQIRRWIVLFNRIIIITLIITAFTLPFLKKENNIKELEKICIYIDNSFSMERTDEKKTSLLDYAKINANQIINQLNNTQQVLIITNDFEKKHQKWYSPKESRELINNIDISNKQENLINILKRYNRIIESNNIHRLYIFSDFQKNAVPITSFENITSNIKIGLLESSQINNISIDTCYFNQPIRQENQIENLQVVISNHNTQDQTITAKLIINNQQKSIYNLDIPAQSSITESFTFINQLDIDIINGYIEIEDNNLQFDNKLYFTYNTNQSLKISTVHDDKLQSALFNVFSDSLFEFSNYNKDYIDYNGLMNSDLIVLSDLINIPNILEKKLVDFLNQGGNIFLFLNENINQNSYNNFFNSINTDILSNWKKINNNVKYINYENELFQDVFKDKKDNINLPQVNEYFATNNNKFAQRREILNLTNNDHFLTQYIYNKGNIFICYSDLKIQNNNFSQHALFIPCLYNSALINLKKEKLYFEIKNATIIEKNNIKNHNIRLVKDGNFDMIPSIVDYGQKTLINFKDGVQQAGIYNLIINKIDTSLISFNYSRLESTMTYYSQTEIESHFLNKHINLIEIKNNHITKKYQDNESHKKLEDFFIIGAIILLIIELILLSIWKI